MVFSKALERNIRVPIEYSNSVDEAELDAAIRALPGYPDWTLESLAGLAESGDLNARLVLAAHQETQ